jgi:hypothetical protein
MALDQDYDPEVEQIARELIAGAKPWSFGGRYPYSKIYSIYKILREDHQIQDTGSENNLASLAAQKQDNQPTIIPPAVFVPEEKVETVAPEPTKPKVTVRGQGNKTTKTLHGGDTAEKIDSATLFDVPQTGHAVTFNQAAVNRIRGILGIQAKPKVLAMPQW